MDTTEISGHSSIASQSHPNRICNVPPNFQLRQNPCDKLDKTARFSRSTILASIHDRNRVQTMNVHRLAMSVGGGKGRMGREYSGGMLVSPVEDRLSCRL